jgi:hypothetical protein
MWRCAAEWVLLEVVNHPPNDTASYLRRLGTFNITAMRTLHFAVIHAFALGEVEDVINVLKG